MQYATIIQIPLPPVKHESRIDLAVFQVSGFERMDVFGIIRHVTDFIVSRVRITVVPPVQQNFLGYSLRKSPAAHRLERIEVEVRAIDALWISESHDGPAGAPEADTFSIKPVND